MHFLREIPHGNSNHPILVTSILIVFDLHIYVYIYIYVHDIHSRAITIPLNYHWKSYQQTFRWGETILTVVVIGVIPKNNFRMTR